MAPKIRIPDRLSDDDFQIRRDLSKDAEALLGWLDWAYHTELAIFS